MQQFHVFYSYDPLGTGDENSMFYLF